MRQRSSRAVQHFMHVHLHARTAVDAGDICTWRTTVILITGQTRRPPIWAPCRNQDGAGSGISGVYLWSCISSKTVFQLCNLSVGIGLHDWNCLQFPMSCLAESLTCFRSKLIFRFLVSPIQIFIITTTTVCILHVCQISFSEVLEDTASFKQ